MPSVNAVLFDCDGVLVDSEPLANQVLSELLGAYGLALTPAECRERFVGLNPRGIASKLLADGGPDLTGPLVERASAMFMDRLRAQGLAPMPGAELVLATLAHVGIPVAAASNSPIDELRLKLELSGLARWFGQHAYSGDALGTPKPQPGVYLHAARRLGVEPRACLVVEDTPTGVRAGVVAGMRVVGFTGAHHDPQGGAQLAAAGAGVIIHGLGELPALAGVV